MQGVADHPTLLKPQGVSAKSMVGESKAVSVQASVVEANCTNIDVCLNRCKFIDRVLLISNVFLLFAFLSFVPSYYSASKSSCDDGKSTSKGPKKKIGPKRS